jgi:hypothetical protein
MPSPSSGCMHHISPQAHIVHICITPTTQQQGPNKAQRTHKLVCSTDMLDGTIQDAPTMLHALLAMAPPSIAAKPNTSSSMAALSIDAVIDA